MDHAQLQYSLTTLQARFSLAWTENTVAEQQNNLFTQNAALHLSNMEHTVHLFHSPHFEVSGDETVAYATWESYGYRMEDTAAVFLTTRFAAEAVQENGVWKYRLVDWMLIQEFSPMAYGADQSAARQFSAPVPEVLEPCDGATWLRLRNLTNLLFVNNWRGAGKWFAENAEVYVQGMTEQPAAAEDFLQRIEAYESANGGRYRLLAITGPGLVQMTGEASAHGSFLAQTFEVRLSEAGEQRIERRFCRMEVSYVNCDAGWRIGAFNLHTLFELPRFVGEGTRYEMMTKGNTNWLYRECDPNTDPGVDALKVENIFSFWPNCVHRGQLSQFFKNFMSTDCVLSIRSQGPGTPPKVGAEEIAGKLIPMDGTFVRGMITYHCATTPVVEYADDGKTIRATWIDHSLTNLGPRTEPVHYMVFVTRYDHVFRKENGRWMLSEFNWEPCLGFPDWDYDMTVGRGFACTEPDGIYPLPLNCESIVQYRAECEPRLSDKEADA